MSCQTRKQTDPEKKIETGRILLLSLGKLDLLPKYNYKVKSSTYAHHI